jgi:alkylation response protein AidB-like acyl-CoA dehydrogenase
MGFAAGKYWETGGFAPLASGEDVDLVRRFEQGGYLIRRDISLSVVTSARHEGRAPNGFATHFRSMLHRRGRRGSGMTTPLVRQWLDAGELNLPLPASGDTVGRWLKLAELTEVDVVAGRLAEAHTDAVAILAELGGPRAQPGQLWGVWAAEAPGHRLTARHDGDGVALEGVKPWCSGAGLCSHALVTAHGVDGNRELFAVDLAQPGVTPLASSWRNAGMATSDTRSVRFARWTSDADRCTG